MEEKNKRSFRETVPHITGTVPFSVHHALIYKGDETALSLHWHPEAELCYLREGEVDFYIEDICLHLSAGEAVFIPPNLLHSIRADLENEGIYWALVFSTDMVVSPADTTRFRKYIQPVSHNNTRFCLHLSPQVSWQKTVLDDLKRLFVQALSDQHSKQGSDSALMIEGLIQVIWHSLYRYHFKQLSEQKPQRKTEDQMLEVVRYIHQHFQEDISLSMLAKTAHMSEGQLCRSFKQLTGSTPFTYLKRHRIIKSCELLLDSDKKISEIATLCGFNNISYFNREFIRIIKEKPSVYRKNRAAFHDAADERG